MRSMQNLPETKFVTTATLTNRTCKWPIGDPLEPGFHYCGHATVSGSPYCELHDKKGYQPLAPQRII
jgi:GcrA cell cycle regulator